MLQYGVPSDSAHLHRDRPVQQHRPGYNFRPRRNLHGLGLTGNQCHPYAPTTGLDSPIGRDLFSGANIYEIPAAQLVRGHGFHALVAFPASRGGNRSGQGESGLRGTSPAARFEHPTGKQQCNEHRERVDVGMPALQRCHEPLHIQHSHTQRYRQVHVEHTVSETRHRPGKERSGTPERHWSRENQRGPLEQRHIPWIHGTPPTGVERD